MRVRRFVHTYIFSNVYIRGKEMAQVKNSNLQPLIASIHSGECATHFGEILTRFPPQVSSRSGAAAWGCHVHNQVNKSLKKDLFDCSKIGDFYDCGCAEDEDAKENDR